MPSAETGAGAAGPDDDVAVVERVIGLIGDLDVEAALELVTDDLVLELPFRADGGSRRLEGDDARRFMRALPRLFTQMRFSDVVVHGQLPSGLIVAEYTSNGMTIAGSAYPNVYVGFFRMRQGRIAGWREYFDPNVVTAAFS
jgi:ketosteroid isomerase-like protein